MKNLDSLTLKFFYEENADFLNGAVIQKIQMPKRAEFLFYIRNQGENRKLYINTNPKYPHLCFIKDKEDYFIKIPKKPPMFCMQLRKYLEGAKIQRCNLIEYDRILEFYFSVSDEFGIENSLVLSIELMGKYSNVILYNLKTGLIVGSEHNVSQDKSKEREIYGGIKYIYPKKQEKSDILKVSYSGFIEKKNDVPNNFYYFSKNYYDFISNGIKNDIELFNILQRAVCDKNIIKEFWGAQKETSFNKIIFEYYSNFVNEDLIKRLKTKLLKPVQEKIKKAKLIIEEEFDIAKFERYQKSGDLIFQYVYLIEKGLKEIELEGLKIKLDENLTPSENAQKYYKLYSKLKSAKLVQEKRKEEAKLDLRYYKELLFTIENAKNPDVLEEIEEEISPQKLEKQEKPRVETVCFEGVEILIGKNNKQNDYIIRKLSNPEDIWLHAYNCPSSHVLIKTQNGKNPVTNNVLLYAANLVKENSPLKDSKKASIIYTKRKYLKRPPNTHLGYVTYEGEKEIVV